jgi:dTDP-4-dehydrorhamnose reductase
MDILTSPPMTETDIPNFTGSFYSATKAPIESILKNYPNTLILRLRMPVSADLSPRSFVIKILAYAHIVNVPNSHSILPSLLPLIVALAEHREEGVYNFTNPGSITHNEVLQLYKDIVDPSTSWKNFTVEQQSKVIVAERSNCALDAGKLLAKVKQYQGEGMDLELPEVRDAYRMCFETIKKGLGGVQQRAGA